MIFRKCIKDNSKNKFLPYEKKHMFNIQSFKTYEIQIINMNNFKYY